MPGTKRKAWIIGLSVLAGLEFADWASGSGITVSAYNLIQQAGSSLAKRSTLNFLGTGVSCADNSGTRATDCTINGVAVANFAQSFTAQTSVTITHNLGTTSVLTQCVNAATPPVVITPQDIAITSSNVVTVTFTSSQSGVCVVNGAGAGTATSVPFSGITTASNTTATMTVGTGGSLTWSGTGNVRASQVVAGGSTFTISGCSVSAHTGGNTAGTYTSGTAGTCTVTITMGGSISAPNGWACYAADQTTPANVTQQTASNATTATLAGVTLSGDVIAFGCIGY